MSKKKKTKQPVKQLSPENYIRQKSRSLPIYECWVNEDWDQSKMAQVTVARQHSNGNISFAVYLVDLWCLGVKDTFFNFNISHIEYQEFLESHAHNTVIKIDYSLAHNIIFAGYDFALELDIPPHKQFSKTTLYFLEEDNEAIELIDIECGKDGKPVILNDIDSFESSSGLYKRLAEKLGEENVILEDEDDLDWDDEEFDDDDDEEFDDDFDVTNFLHGNHEDIDNYQYKNVVKERNNDINNFKQIIVSEDEQSEEDLGNLIDVTTRLFYNHFDVESIKNCRNWIDNKIDIDISDAYIDELIGVESELYPDLYDEIDDLIDSDFITDLPEILQYIEDYSDVPFFKYFHVLHTEMISESDEDEAETIALIDKYLKQHPDYFILRIKKEFYNIDAHKKSEIIEPFLNSDSNIYEFFLEKDLFHPLEYRELVMAIFGYYVSNQKHLEMDCLAWYLSTVQIELFSLFKEIHMTNMMLKTEFCKKMYVNPI